MTSVPDNRSTARFGLPIMTVIFPVLSLLALLFVFWISFSSFENNSYEIFRQSYRTIITQSVSDMESSLQNGKTIESFYAMDKLLTKVASYIRKDAQAAVTDPEGALLYSTFDMEELYTGLLQMENVKSQMAQEFPDRDDIVVTSGGFELMIRPIYDQQNRQLGNMCLIYPSRDPDFVPGFKRRILIMTLLVAGIVIIATIVFLLIQNRKPRVGKRGAMIPVAILVMGIMIQSGISLFAYQEQYRDMMMRNARTVCTYIGSLISQAHDKGVPYDRMYGLDVFLVDKLNQTPALWDIKLVQVLADSQEILTRPSEYSISVPLNGDNTLIMSLDVTISNQFMNQKMLEMLLLFLITLFTSIVAIIEIMRLPELVMLRVSGEFSKPEARQGTGVRSCIRMCTFMLYTGAYIVMPFSALLIREWRQPLFGLSLDVTASLPMTVEVLALMLGSLLSATLFKRWNVRVGLGLSFMLLIVSNLACLFAMSPLWLIVFRFLSGIGFTGVLYVSNYIVSYGSDGGSERAGMLAGINAGLLGGIMVGGSLGAVIANMGISICFMAAIGIFVATGLVLFALMPWRLFSSQSESDEKTRARPRTLRTLFHPRLISYLLLVLIPLSLGLMFIVSGMPMFVQINGLSPLLLSCGYLANGIAGIYLGVPMLSFFQKRMTRDEIIVAALLLGGLAVGVLFLPLTWLMLLVCAFLLGIFDGVGTPTIMNDFLELPGIRDLRPVDALAIENTVLKAINSAAPMVYGLIISLAANGSFVFGILGGAFIVAGVVYFAINKAFLRGQEV